MEGYSFIKELEGTKYTEDDKKGNTIIEGENKEKENLFIETIMAAEDEDSDDFDDMGMDIEKPNLVSYE